MGGLRLSAPCNRRRNLRASSDPFLLPPNGGKKREGLEGETNEGLLSTQRKNGWKKSVDVIICDATRKESGKKGARENEQWVWDSSENQD